MKEYVVTFAEGEPLKIKAEYLDANSVAFVFTTAAGTVAVVPNTGRVLYIVESTQLDTATPEPASLEPEPAGPRVDPLWGGAE